MKLENVLEKLEEFFRKWGLGLDDWLLIAHYAHKLEGYEVKFKEGHFNIMINRNKLAWGQIHWRKRWKYQIFPPINSSWARDYNHWQKNTKFDADFIPISKKEIDELIKNRKYSFIYKLPNGKALKIIKVRGLLKRYEDSFPPPASIEKELGLEKAMYYLKIIEEWKKLATERKEKEVVNVCNKLLKKYDFLKSKFKTIHSYKNIKEIKGSPTFKGYSKGKARVILDESKAYQLAKEEILVVKMTSSKFISVVNRAKAIITDDGGILCHAAILSREFKIPCIVSTKVATKVLRDGDLIEVDAEKGVVKILAKAK